MYKPILLGSDVFIDFFHFLCMTSAIIYSYLHWVLIGTRQEKCVEYVISQMLFMIATGHNIHM